MEQITEIMQNADPALHLHQIVSKSKQPEHVVRAFIREQSAFGNVDVVPARGRYGNRYEWVGPVPIKEEMLALAKEVEAESVAEAQLEPAVGELDGLPEELLAKLDLPDSVTAQPENVTIEPKQATNVPKTFTNEQKDMTNAENTTTTAQPLTPKVRYLIQAAKDKMATANSEKSAKQIAKRFVNEGHKRVEISTIYPFAVAKQGIEVERVWLG